MAVILVATYTGCRVFDRSGEAEMELAGHHVGSLTREAGGACLVVVDAREIWQRDVGGKWSRVPIADIPLQSIRLTSAYA